MLEINKIYSGDALSVLKTFPANAFDCCITSPPYWQLRDYHIEGQLGLEEDIETYIKALCDIFDEVKRSISDFGTLWVNIGDTYMNNSSYSDKGRQGYEKKEGMIYKKSDVVRLKSLCNIPFRFAVEMTRRGWIQRNTIIWHKPNCLPSSVRDRFTVDFEYLFLFSKQENYYFETQFESVESGKRNKRCVWKISNKGKKGHHAVFPEELITTPLLAGCPEKVCEKCGSPKYPIIESDKKENNAKWHSEIYGSEDEGTKRLGRMRPEKRVENTSKIVGYTDCGCNVSFRNGIVLDPFMGSGTTAEVAIKNNRSYIGIELNEKYLKNAEDNIKNLCKQKGLF